MHVFSEDTRGKMRGHISGPQEPENANEQLSYHSRSAHGWICLSWQCGCVTATSVMTEASVNVTASAATTIEASTFFIALQRGFSWRPITAPTSRRQREWNCLDWRGRTSRWRAARQRAGSRPADLPSR